MSDEPSLPVSLREPLLTDPAQTVAADVVARELAHEHRPVPRPGFLASINWADPELLSVIATFLFMLLGKFGSAVGLPAPLAPWFFLAAYLTGGWHGTIHGLRSLLRGTVDVDLLMILAALGAAYVNHAFEGADAPLSLLAFEHAAGHGDREKPLRHLGADETAARYRALQAGHGNATRTDRATRGR